MHNTNSMPTFFVIGDDVNLRKDANIKSTKITKLSFGSTVHIINSTSFQETHNKRKSQWYYIRTVSGLEGWVFGGFLSNYRINDPQELLDMAERLNEANPTVAYDYIKQVFALKAKEYNIIFDMTTHDRAIELLAINECFRSDKNPYYQSNIKDLATGLKKDFQSANFPNLYEKSSCSMDYDACESDNFGNIDRSSFILLLKNRLRNKKIEDKIKVGKNSATLYATDINGLDAMKVTLNFSNIKGLWEWTSINFCAD